VRDDYLDRLGIDPAGRPLDRGLLRELQVAHLIAVPFENLHVFHRRGVDTAVTSSVAKILDHRGGWCFELNGAFGWLLRDLGYDATYVACRVHGDDGWGPEFDHCALVVRIDGDPWFVDVGFGDACMVPVPLVAGDHDGVPRPVRVRTDGTAVVLAELGSDGLWADRLHIDPAPRTMDEFEPRSTYLQTEPGLMWTEKPFATRATAADGSRVTLRNGVLRVRTGAEEPVDVTVDEADWSRLLRDHLGITDDHRRDTVRDVSESVRQ
jgi:N-hydroxyarylamine O-acetyltransferase